MGSLLKIFDIQNVIYVKERKLLDTIYIIYRKMGLLTQNFT